MKRCLCLLLALLVLPMAALSQSEDEATSLPVADEVKGAETIVSAETPDYVPWLLDVARDELGYVEGAGNDTKYGLWAGDRHAAWCAEFVCWCVDQVDQQRQTDLLQTVYPKYSGQNTGRDWFIKRGRFVYRKGNVPEWGPQWLLGQNHNLQKNEYVPCPGDLIFFSYDAAGDTEHVALVEYSAVDERGDVMIHVIEGNNPDRVQRNTYRLNNSQVLGFGTPVKRVGTTMRFGCSGDEVEQLQRDLVYLELLDERHITGTFGSNTRAAVSAFQDGMQGHSSSGVADMRTQQELALAVQQKIFDSPETWLVKE